jgi:alkyl hydroperoxide reductase subunit AhpC
MNTKYRGKRLINVYDEVCWNTTHASLRRCTGGVPKERYRSDELRRFIRLSRCLRIPQSDAITEPIMTVYTAEPAPELIVPTLTGETFTLADRNPRVLTILVFYRGAHCPICKEQAKEIEENYQKALDEGMEIIMVSMDTKEKAMKFSQDVASTIESSETTIKVPIGYGLTESQARSWNLYISENWAGTSEPPMFSEPAIFAILPDTTVLMVQMQSSPFTRPNMTKLIDGLTWAITNNYPIRGSLTRTSH